MEAKMGTLRRMFTCIAISNDDNFAFCGTKTGGHCTSTTCTCLFIYTLGALLPEEAVRALSQNRDVVRLRIDRDPIPRSFNEPDK
eukprot:38729-Eustigmatos_ZCMA.PRE.1